MNSPLCQKIRFLAATLTIGILLLTADTTLGQGGFGGPPPEEEGGGEGGGGGGSGGSGTTSIAHYVFSTEHTGDRIGPPWEWWSSTGYFSGLTFAKTKVNRNHTMVYEVKVRDEAEKLQLDPNEIVEVDFKVTLADYDQEPYDWEAPNQIGTPIGYSFSTNDFQVLELVNGTPPTTYGFFEHKGDSFIGYAKLKYSGLSGTGKCLFKISDGDGAALGDSYVNVVWCTHAPPEPITQSDVPCIGCHCFDQKGSSVTCAPEPVQQVLRQTYLTTSDSGGIGGTCLSCGGAPAPIPTDFCPKCCGADSGSPTNALPGMTLSHLFVPTRQDIVGSFGPGLVSNLDYRLEVYEACPNLPFGFVAILFDPCTGQSYLYRNPTTPPHFEPDQRRYHSDFDITDANGNIVSDMSNLHLRRAKILRVDGVELLFELVDIGTDPQEPAKYLGRLLTIKDKTGYGLTFTYKSFTPAEITASPERQLQIDTITDPYGVVATVTYLPTQLNSRWVIEKMDIVGYTDQTVVIGYGYGVDGHLTYVTRDNQALITYSYGAFPGWHAATITYENRLDSSLNGTGTVFLSEDYRSWNGQVANQVAGVLVGRADGSGYRNVRITPDQNNPSTFMIENSGQLVRWVRGQSLQYIHDWTIDPNASGVERYVFDENTQESKFAIHPQSTPDEVCSALNPVTTDETGLTLNRTYDARGNNLRTNYPDGSYSLKLYNAADQVDYSRDRGGYVTVNERNSNGKIVRVIRGLKDNDDNVDDNGYLVVPGSQPLQTIYGYNAAGLMEWTATNAYVAGPVQAPPANTRTDYEYFANHRIKSITKPLPHGQTVRPKDQFVWSGAQLSSTTNERNATSNFMYDPIGRVISTGFQDATSEHVWFDDTNNIIYRKNRVGAVSRQERDAAWRPSKQTVAYGHDANLLDQAVDTVHPAYEQSVTENEYWPGQGLPKSTKVNGKRSDVVYDYRGRVVERIQYPRVGMETKNKNIFQNNMLFATEESFGTHVRRSYRAYSADRTTVRIVNTRVPTVQYADNDALMNLIRVNGTEPDFSISDAVRDLRGNIVQLFDAYGTETRNEYDELERQVKQTQGFGLPLALVTENEYDADGNLVKTIDAAGAETVSTFDDAGNVVTRTVGFGTALALTTSFEYDSDGAPNKTTAPGGAVTEQIRSDCCGHTVGVKNALGHGSINNMNAVGQSIHSATVEDFVSHTDVHNPVDAKTLGESTSRYFDNGQLQFQTRWKTALGSIDPADPPIAGINSVAAADGVTTQYVYDNRLFDGVGLDSSTGLTINRLGGGTAAINITAAITKLGETTANGGAGITFAVDRTGSATVALSPDEKTMQVSISDAAGRTVMSASLYGPAATAPNVPNSLITWSCTLQEQVYSLAAFGDTEEIQLIDPDGNIVHSLTDGFGQSVGSLDQLGNLTRTKFDEAGNQKQIVDAAGRTTTFGYDALGRQISTIDALNQTVSTAYDSATGRVSSRTDAKNNSTSFTYDILGRTTVTTDRLGKTTTNGFDNTGRLQTITDAQGKTTTYGYNLLGQRTSTTLADSGAKAMSYDAAGRMVETTLASGIEQKSIYEFSGVLDKIEYRNAGGTLTGTDDYSYDVQLRRTGSTSRSGVTSALAYTERGQLDSDTTTYGGQSYLVGYDYDDRGRLEKITYPSGRNAEYSFDNRSLLDTIKWDGVQIEDRAYNTVGLLTGVDRQAVDETRAYDALNRVTTIGNTNVGDASYTYDANGNKLTEAWTGVMSAWNFTTQNAGTFADGYDAEDRFRNFVQAGKSVDLFLDRTDIGNISNYKLNSVDSLRSYSNIHELTSVGGTAQTFDTDGNLTVAHSGVDLGWDEAGLLKQTIVSAGDTAGIEGTNEYGYDASQKRVWKKITRSSSVVEHTVYIYAGPNCIAEYAAGTAATSPNQEFVYANDIDSLVMLVRSGGSEKLTVTRNQQWSVSALANAANGTVLERYTYDAFGKRTILAADGATVRATSSYNMPYGYTSRRHDAESGLMYFRARYYDSATGEFCSKDPLEYVDGMSLYRAYFVPNNLDAWGINCKNAITKGGFFPRFAPRDVPWDNRELIENEAAGKDVVFLGLTVMLIDVRCDHECICCEPDKKFKPNCEVNIKFHILLDENEIKLSKNHFPKPTKENTYGHEQRHVENLKQCIGGYHQQIVNKSNKLSYADKFSCEFNNELDIQSIVMEYVQDCSITEGKHGAGDRNFIPQPGTGYDPIGQMPENPTPVFPPGANTAPPSGW